MYGTDCIISINLPRFSIAATHFLMKLNPTSSKRPDDDKLAFTIMSVLTTTVCRLGK